MRSVSQRPLTKKIFLIFFITFLGQMELINDIQLIIKQTNLLKLILSIPKNIILLTI
jgi:hypothetical protein